jgi:phosphorylcholine metabolism protein LicD
LCKYIVVHLGCFQLLAITNKESFCKIKDTVDKTNWQPTDWEKNIFTNPTSDRGVIFKIYKGLKKLITKKQNKNKQTNNPIKKWGIEIN